MVANSSFLSDNPTPRIFEDVPEDSTFYKFVQRLARRYTSGSDYQSVEPVIVGYTCGGVNPQTQESEPCIAPGNRPYFRPYNNATRGQIAKIISNGANYYEAPGNQRYQDVPSSNVFFKYINRLGIRNIITGYACGQYSVEPCVEPNNLPYFRPSALATRGQLTKMIARAFFPNSNCGTSGAGEGPMSPEMTPAVTASVTAIPGTPGTTTTPVVTGTVQGTTPTPGIPSPVPSIPYPVPSMPAPIPTGSVSAPTQPPATITVLVP
jgi:hypothetical protein